LHFLVGCAYIAFLLDVGKKITSIEVANQISIFCDLFEFHIYSFLVLQRNKPTVGRLITVFPQQGKEDGKPIVLFILFYVLVKSKDFLNFLKIYFEATFSKLNNTVSPDFECFQF